MYFASVRIGNLLLGCGLWFCVLGGSASAQEVERFVESDWFNAVQVTGFDDVIGGPLDVANIMDPDVRRRRASVYAATSAVAKETMAVMERHGLDEAAKVATLSSAEMLALSQEYIELMAPVFRGIGFELEAQTFVDREDKSRERERCLIASGPGQFGELMQRFEQAGVPITAWVYDPIGGLIVSHAFGIDRGGFDDITREMSFNSAGLRDPVQGLIEYVEHEGVHGALRGGREAGKPSYPLAIDIRCIAGKPLEGLPPGYSMRASGEEITAWQRGAYRNLIAQMQVVSALEASFDPNAAYDPAVRTLLLEPGKTSPQATLAFGQLNAHYIELALEQIRAGTGLPLKKLAWVDHRGQPYVLAQQKIVTAERTVQLGIHLTEQSTPYIPEQQIRSQVGPILEAALEENAARSAWGHRVAAERTGLVQRAERVRQRLKLPTPPTLNWR